MVSIISHIEYLVLQNDCVVVPGFGAFIAQYRPAYFDERGMLFPPSRTVGFNDVILHNDGILASSIMRKERISYDHALRLVAEETLALKHQLRENKELDLGNLGRFVFSEDDKLLFEPSSENIANSENFGLASVTLPDISESAFLDAERLPDDNVEQSIPPIRNLLKIAASIAALIALTFILSTPIAIDKAPDYAGISHILHEKVSSAEKKDSTVSLPENRDPDKEIDLPTIERAYQKEIGTEAGGSVAEQDAESLQSQYYVIVASLRTKEQALQYIEESKLKDLKVLGKNGGIYRVYIKSGNSLADMTNFIQNTSLRESNPDVWIYKTAYN